MRRLWQAIYREREREREREKVGEHTQHEFLVNVSAYQSSGSDGGTNGDFSRCGALMLLQFLVNLLHQYLHSFRARRGEEKEKGVKRKLSRGPSCASDITSNRQQQSNNYMMIDRPSESSIFFYFLFLPYIRIFSSLKQETVQNTLQLSSISHQLKK